MSVSKSDLTACPDGLSRPLKMIDSSMSVTRYDGTTVSNQWNDAGRLAARVWPEGTNSCTYYSNGMLESAAQGDCVVSNQVDSGGLLLRQDVAMGAHSAAVEYDYNPAGLPVTNQINSESGSQIVTV